MGDIPPIHPDGIALLRKEVDVEVVTHLMSEDELADRISDFNAIVLGAPRLTRRVIFAGKKLEVIFRGGIGVDNIDVNAASEKGVVVANLLDVLSKTVAEHAMMFMLGISREIALADRYVRAGKWKEFAKIPHTEICGKTVGIIGLGGIGVAVAEMALSAFKMKILTTQNSHLKQEHVQKAEAQVVSLERLLRESDYVILSVPLNSETDRMIGETELGLMKSTSYLINIARGKVVDQGALYKALSRRRIAGAALDVLAKQPPDPSDPLLQLDNVIFTPHDAAITNETGRKAALLIAGALLDLFHGKLPRHPVNVINPKVAEMYIRGVNSSKT